MRRHQFVRHCDQQRSDAHRELSAGHHGAVVLVAGVAHAHPHVWITFKSELLYAPDGTLTGIHHLWTFDDMFSTFATHGAQSAPSFGQTAAGGGCCGGGCGCGH